MKLGKKETLLIELVGAFHQLKKKAFESLKFQFKQSNLSPIQWRLLCLLQNSEGESPGKLADKLGISRSAVSQYINGLLSEGLVSLKIGSRDRRQRQVKLTDKGLFFLKDSRRKNQQAFEALFAALSEEEIETLLKIFRKLLQSDEFLKQKP
jgi:DNA-binding MarR family transcriptional regulator